MKPKSEGPAALANASYSTLDCSDVEPVVNEWQLLFQTSSYAEIRELTAHCVEGLLTLEGTVSSYYLKQLAQSLFIGLPGYDRLQNEVVVQAEPTHRPFHH